MSSPVIVKPSVACGVSEAHAMTLVLRPEGFSGISCALPACVQEYIDHAAMLYKVYVVGSEVRYPCNFSFPPDCEPATERCSGAVADMLQVPCCAGAHRPEAVTARLGALRRRQARQAASSSAI